MIKKITCQVCGKTQPENLYFKYKDNSKHYPTCKACCYHEMDIWNIDTIIPYMKEFDIPYIPDQWDKYRRLHPTEKTIFGRYYALMRLRGYRGYGFNDTFQFIDAMVKNK